MAATAKAPARASQPQADGPPPELQALGLAFRRMFRALGRMRGRDTHLAGGDLSHAQFELLIELDERGELSAGELALAARISSPSVTQMLEGLVESGYVARTRSDSDRRVVLATLTALGRARVEAKRAAWQQRWQLALADVSRREMKAATNVLERLAEMFDEAPDGGACSAEEDDVQAASQTPR